MLSCASSLFRPYVFSTGETMCSMQEKTADSPESLTQGPRDMQ